MGIIEDLLVNLYHTFDFSSLWYFPWFFRILLNGKFDLKNIPELPKSDRSKNVEEKFHNALPCFNECMNDEQKEKCYQTKNKKFHIFFLVIFFLFSEWVIFTGMILTTVIYNLCALVSPYFYFRLFKSFLPMITPELMNMYLLAQEALPVHLRPSQVHIDKLHRAPDAVMWMEVGYICACQILYIIFYSMSYICTSRLGLRGKSFLSTLVYRKVFKLSGISKKEHTEGKINNLLSIDCDAFMSFSRAVREFIDFLFVVPLFGLLIYFLGYSVIAGSVFLAIALVFIFAAAGLMSFFYDKARVISDKRVKRIYDTLSCIKTVKFFAAENFFVKRILKKRKNEMINLQFHAFFYAICVALICSSSQGFLYLSFSTYYFINGENALVDAITLYCAYICISLLLKSVEMGYTFVESIGLYFVCQKRVLGFLNAEERVMIDMKKKGTSFLFPVVIRNAVFEFPREEEGEEEEDLLDVKKMIKSQPKWENVFVFSNLGSKRFHLSYSLSVERGTLVGISGDTGCGKSSLLLSLLQEKVQAVDFDEFKLNGKIAYVPQNPFLLSTTIKENICVDREFDEEYFDSVVRMCCLEDDLNVNIKGGMNAFVGGSDGGTMSTGQQNRISLARALYSDADIYLIDDIFVSFDPIIRKKIFDFTLKYLSFLRQRKNSLIKRKFSIGEEVLGRKRARSFSRRRKDSIQTEGRKRRGSINKPPATIGFLRSPKKQYHTPTRSFSLAKKSKEKLEKIVKEKEKKNKIDHKRRRRSSLFEKERKSSLGRKMSIASRKRNMLPKTVFIVTNDHDFLKRMKHCVYMEKGKILRQGSYYDVFVAKKEEKKITVVFEKTEKQRKRRMSMRSTMKSLRESVKSGNKLRETMEMMRRMKKNIEEIIIEEKPKVIGTFKKNKLSIFLFENEYLDVNNEDIIIYYEDVLSLNVEKLKSGHFQFQIIVDELLPEDEEENEEENDEEEVNEVEYKFSFKKRDSEEFKKILTKKLAESNVDDDEEGDDDEDISITQKDVDIEMGDLLPPLPVKKEKSLSTSISRSLLPSLDISAIKNEKRNDFPKSPMSSPPSTPKSPELFQRETDLMEFREERAYLESKKETIKLALDEHHLDFQHTIRGEDSIRYSMPAEDMSLNYLDQEEFTLVENEKKRGGVSSIVLFQFFRRMGCFSLLVLIALFIFAVTVYGFGDLFVSSWIEGEFDDHFGLVYNATYFLNGTNSTMYLNCDLPIDSHFNDVICPNDTDCNIVSIPISWMKYSNGNLLKAGEFPSYIAIIVILGVFLLVLISTVAAQVCLNYLIVKASNVFHNDAIRSLLRAPMLFFEKNRIGRVLSRLSNDQNIVDTVTVVWLSGFFMFFVGWMETMFVVSFVFPYIGLIFGGIIILLLLSYVLLRNVVVDLARLKKMAISKILSQNSETMKGISSLRCYFNSGQPLIGCKSNRPRDNFKYFMKKYQQKLDVAICSEYLIYAQNNLVIFLIDIISFLMFLVVIFFIYITQQDGTSLPLASLCLSIYAIKQFGNYLRGATIHLIEAEGTFTSVERLGEYSLKIVPEEKIQKKKVLCFQVGSDEKKPPEGWPKTGSIVFRSFSLKYSVELDYYSLNNITLEIRSGEKIGVCGRTGSGKSTLCSVALFRLINIPECISGEIWIDGLDINRLSLKSLRRGIEIIQSNPILFKGTLRENLVMMIGDHVKVTDNDLWDVLDRIGIKEYIEYKSKGLGLNMKIENGGKNFSSGERQLINIARILLKKEGIKILILDEIFSALDRKYATLIMEVIQRYFKDCTVLTIAHHLNTLVKSDRILVLHEGKVMEFDSPYNLLTDDKHFLFKELLRDSGKENEVQFVEDVIEIENERKKSKFKKYDSFAEKSLDYRHIGNTFISL